MNINKLFFTSIYITFLISLTACSNIDIGKDNIYPTLDAPIISRAETERIETPNGGSVKTDVEHINLSGVKHEDIDELLKLIDQLKSLEYINLGKDNGIDSLTPEDIFLLINTYPEIKFDYIFNVFGKEISLDTEVLDFNHVSMDDNGDKIVGIMRVLRNPVSLDMDFTGVDNSVMEQLRIDYPYVDIQWRIWIGRMYSIRTDAERFVASEPAVEILTGNELDPLKYCTKLKYLDIGHNEITDISFIQYLTELESAVICLNEWTDLSPISSCTKLNYLEINDTKCTDLSPLEYCTELEHLNVCNLGDVTGWDKISQLSKLKRLWIGINTNISDDTLNILKHSLPNTEINITTESSDLGTWRWTTYPERTERYEQLFLEMGYYMSPSNQSYYYHDPLYYPEGYTGSTTVKYPSNN